MNTSNKIRHLETLFWLWFTLDAATTNAFVFSPTTTSCSRTVSSLHVLHAQQKKPPRFTQKAHARKTKSPSSQRVGNGSSKKIKKKQPWDSEKSIEDLEAAMLKRWGTLESNNPSSNVNKKGGGGQDLRRPVFDPWAEDDGNKNGDNFVREFYDEDDEGYEYIEIEDGEDIQGIKVEHLISPRPAGGRGSSKLADEPSGSYFFNPNKKSTSPEAPTTTTTSSRTNRNERSSEIAQETMPEQPSNKKNKKERKPRPPPAQPVLDEDGDPILLTVDEALYRFQSEIDDDTMQIIETAEVPIVACTNAQSWEDLGITSPILLENLRDMNCPSPLAVQEKACPPVITGNDVLVGTYTGSGKTLAFLTPLVERLLWNEDSSKLGLAVLIVAPGRELASQIVSVARSLLEGTGLTVQLAIGGTTFSRNLEQIRKRKPNIIVGTPGRIAELAVGKPGEKSGRLKISSLQALVLDEFDALLEYKPHRDPTHALMHLLKRRHGDALQSILCSATASDIMESSKVVDFLRPGYATAMADQDDVLVTNNAKAAQVSRTVIHGVVHVPHKRLVLETVRKILHTEPVPQQILIFVENARKVDIVVEKLATMGIVAAPLHGGMGSDKMDRAEVSKALRDGYVGIVVATELAARGLDAPLLTHVINVDLPTDASHYAHRAGRCGRGGRPGVVINITTSPQERNVPKRFASSLGIDMHVVEPRKGMLMLIDPETQTVN